MIFSIIKSFLVTLILLCVIYFGAIFQAFIDAQYPNLITYFIGIQAIAALTFYIWILFYGYDYL